MGRDPKSPVLNSFNQAQDFRNLVVTDGGTLVSSSDLACVAGEAGVRGN